MRKSWYMWLVTVVALAVACGGSAPRTGDGTPEPLLPSRLPRVAPVASVLPPATTPPEAESQSTPAVPEVSEAAGAADVATESAVPLPDDELTIVYSGTEFHPKRLEAPVGQRVTFVNDSDERMWPASNIHPTHEILPGLEAQGPVEPGESWSFVFEEPGFWRYHNHLSPTQNGIVVIAGDPRVARAEPLLIDPGDLTFQEVGAVPVQDLVDVFQDDALLGTFVKTYGPAGTVRILSENAYRVGVDCHTRAHVMGRLAYEEFGAAAFSLSGHECHSGGYHGATEAFFRDRGTSHLESDIGVVCGTTLNDFFRHQCVHGIGHGLMAWTSYELFDALQLCDLLATVADQGSCYSGVFMENVVGGLSGSMGHFSEFLSDDPHFPCNIVDDHYVVPCYFYQSSRMVQVLRGDFEQVAATCAEAPARAHPVCFASMGRDVGGATRGNPEKAIELCSYVDDPANRLECLGGAAQDSFWDPSGADDALTFCEILTQDDEKRRCYLIIVDRAGFIYDDEQARVEFCKRVEEAYREGCG